MARVDARVKTKLPVKLVNAEKPGGEKSSATISEISLSGMLVQGPVGEAETVSIRSDLPEQGEVLLKGKIVRRDNGKTAVALFYSDPATISGLWEHVRNGLSDVEGCPYCGFSNGKAAISCPECGRSLNFADGGYLERHLRATFLARLQSRIEFLDQKSLQKIIALIDKELLKFQGQPSEEEFVGTTAAMLDVFKMIRKVGPTDMSVLILGESGTGKELTARAIHERSGRKDKPFVAVNCAAIPEGLIEAELFGYEKGAFTGAYATRKGKFEFADGGTLFLDEIGDLPPGLQAKLLRFLEDRIVERIGAKGGKKVDVRIVAATNCDIKTMTDTGDFRNDLFFRLSAFTVTLPPLRERGQDKVVLANYFLRKITQAEGSSVQGFSEDALRAIMAYPWHGNVRELINKVRRGIVMASGDYIEPSEMELEMPCPQEQNNPLKSQVSKTQKEVVLKALEENDYVIARAARALGVSRPSLYALMKKHQIKNTHAGS